MQLSDLGVTVDESWCWQMELAVLEKAAEVARVLERVAKHNIVALAILTQEEAQKAEIAGKAGRAAPKQDAAVEPQATEEQPSQSEGATQHGSQPVTYNSVWQISWDFSHHKCFPVISLKKFSAS